MSCQQSPSESKPDGVIAINYLWDDPENINVCLVNPEAASAYNNDSTDVVAEIKAKVQSEFARTDRVRFVGWKNCDDLDDSSKKTSVRTYLRDGGFGLGGGVSMIGSGLGAGVSGCDGCTMQIGINNYNHSQGKTASLSTAVHEFEILMDVW